MCAVHLPPTASMEEKAKALQKKEWMSVPQGRRAWSATKRRRTRWATAATQKTRGTRWKSQMRTKKTWSWTQSSRKRLFFIRMRKFWTTLLFLVRKVTVLQGYTLTTEGHALKAAENIEKDKFLYCHINFLKESWWKVEVKWESQWLWLSWQVLHAEMSHCALPSQFLLHPLNCSVRTAALPDIPLWAARAFCAPSASAGSVLEI